MTDTRPYHNQATQTERREVLNTYLGHAQADADLAAGGRFKKQNETQVNGVPTYPQQPENSWASSDPTGPEPPLGFAVDAMEPVGSAHEIQASLEAARTDDAPASVETAALASLPEK